MSIAFFDSGLGGISVLSEAKRNMPDQHFIYYADTLHVPYGTKTKEVVKGYVLSAIGTIMEETVQAVVIACNTATSVAIRDLRSIYSIPIIGMEPAVKPAVEMNRQSGRRVLVTATPLTLQESKYNDLVKRVDDQAIVDSLPLPELVDFCEQLLFDGPTIEAYFNEKFSGINFEEYGTIVLGCTHFPFYRFVLSRLLPKHMKIIDGGNGTVRRLMEVIGYNEGRQNRIPGTVRFLHSGGDGDYTKKMEEAFRRYGEMAFRGDL